MVLIGGDEMEARSMKEILEYLREKGIDVVEIENEDSKTVIDIENSIENGITYNEEPKE